MIFEEMNVLVNLKCKSIHHSTNAEYFAVIKSFYILKQNKDIGNVHVFNDQTNSLVVQRWNLFLKKKKRHLNKSLLHGNMKIFLADSEFVFFSLFL